jgi:RNA polymerase sigma factor (sigma-70 family)
MTSACALEVRSGRLPSQAVERVVARAVAGDHSAWDALIDEFGGVVWAATRAHRLDSADAADAFQVTWMRLVESLGRINDPARLGPWLATTARRECLAVLRRARTDGWISRGDDLPDLPSDAPHPAERLIGEESVAALREALNRLKRRDRALLRMLTVEPVSSYEEISAALNMPIGSIGPTRARALARLRDEAARSGLIAQPLTSAAPTARSRPQPKPRSSPPGSRVRKATASTLSTAAAPS